MDLDSFKATAHQLVDWMAEYFQNIEQYPVKSQVNPGDIYQQIPEAAPDQSQDVQRLLQDFENIIMPGITHWQHPKFHAYFNANSSYPSVLAEMLTSTLASQCMLWETSPAASELEQRTMEWLRDLLYLPGNWEGVIQDGASTATLVSLLTSREKRSQWKINQTGYQPEYKYRLYCSEQAHSSIEKAVRISGMGSESLVKIEVDQHYAMSASSLERQVRQDVESGYCPLWLVATLGTTSSTAIDPLEHIGAICRKHGMWLHVDAAWAGTAMMLPEADWLRKGLEFADSFVFNPHKWMFTNFDCTAYFTSDSKSLIKTFSLVPEYLKTDSSDKVNNYSDWGIQLGRRFRALKLWFVMRSYGKSQLRQTIANHISWVSELAQTVRDDPDFELMAPAPLALLCFRYNPAEAKASDLNALNARLLNQVNNTGKVYITHTKLRGQFTLRLAAGQTYLERKQLMESWNLIKEISHQLS